MLNSPFCIPFYKVKILKTQEKRLIFKTTGHIFIFMRDKQTRKNEIIKASISVMYLKGYNGTSVKDITDAAGIPKGSFYNYFENKEHYAVDVIDYYFSEVLKKRLSILKNKNISPLDRIKEFYNSSIMKLEKHKVKLGCLIGNLTQEMGESSELISNATAEAHDKFVELILSNLNEAKERKKLNSMADLQKLASFIVSSWQGALLRVKVTSNQKVLDDFLCILDEILLREIG